MFELCQAIALSSSVYDTLIGQRPYPDDGPADFRDMEL
jgi:hypothetical protein